LKRSYVIAGVFIILASTFLIEYYTNTRFPTQEIIISNVPELEIGRVHTFSYEHELELVGTYSYTITSKQGDLYTLVSSTDVTVEAGSIQLESSFVFDEQYKPEEYILTVDQDGDINEFEVSFTGGNVVSNVTFANETVTLSEEFPEGAYLVENNMPGFWEILLLSSDLDIGARYTAQVYIPQGGTLFELEFYVQNDPQTITVEGKQLSCTIIQESKLDLKFYLYNGEMVQMRNNDQDIIFTRLPN
jgi:hypothetical protein